MELKPGYKQTPLGWIPEDWDHVQIGDVASVKGGKRLPEGYLLQDIPTPHPYVRVSDMFPGGVDASNIRYVPDRAFSYIQNYRIYTTDIFISVAGTLGIVGVVPPILDGANLTENADRITDLRCDRNFLMYWLMSTKIQSEILSIRTVGAQPKLALGRIAQFDIALPKLRSEQCAIAEALSDVDALLGALDRLISKKRDLKQAAMQQLLTGRTRLPGFSGEWEVKRLGRLGEFFKGSGIRRDEALSGELPCVRYGELYTIHDDIVRSFASRISLAVAATARRIRRGDVLFAGSGETKEEIGKSAAIVQDVEAFAGGDIVILRLHDGDPAFFGYLMNTPLVAHQKANLGQGDAVVHISATALASVEVAVPKEAEQRAISTVLADMDAELEALEQRRAKTAALKQGMMQELLTGRTRLV